MKSSLTLIKIISVLAVGSIGCSVSVEEGEFSGGDSTHSDSTPVVVDSSHCAVDTIDCDKRIMQQTMDLVATFDTILQILSQQIDSAKYAEIVNSKSLQNDKQKEKYLKNPTLQQENGY